MSDPKTTHGTCPDCGHSGCLSVWEGGTYCHSCETSTGKGKREEPMKVDTEIFDSIRGITKDVCEKYGVTIGLAEDGTEVRHNYPYPHKVKYRYLPKDFSKNSGFSNDHLFGMDKFNASSGKIITVTEGELDALSAYQMLGKKWPVVSLPNASLGTTLLKNVHPYLDSYSKIIVATDSDEAGNRVATKLAATFPGKVYRMLMTTHKDANEFLQAHHERDFMFAWTNAEKFIPSDIYHTARQFGDILSDEEANTYIETPIGAFNEVCKGLMQGHLTVILGEEGLGKTEVLRMLEVDILQNHKDIPIAVNHMEETKKTCLLSYASYVLDENLRDPDHTVPQTKVEEAIEGLTDSENLYLFEMGIDEDPLSILDKVRYLTEVCHCKYIFLDPIQQLAYGRDLDTTEEQTLSRIAVQLERLANEINVGIIITAHVNDDGATRSSRMIGKSASVRVVLKRDHMNEDPEVRNTTYLSVTKNRPVGPTGFGGALVFNPKTFKLEEY